MDSCYLDIVKGGTDVDGRVLRGGGKDFSFRGKMIQSCGEIRWKCIGCQLWRHEQKRNNSARGTRSLRELTEAG